MLTIDSLYAALSAPMGQGGEVKKETKEEKARWLAEALLDHMRMVRNFAATYPELYSNGDSSIDRERWRAFTAAARSRATGAEELWSLVKQTAEFAELINTERIEAEIADIRSIIRSLPTGGRPWKEN